MFGLIKPIGRADPKFGWTNPKFKMTHFLDGLTHVGRGTPIGRADHKFGRDKPKFKMTYFLDILQLDSAHSILDLPVEFWSQPVQFGFSPSNGFNQS